MSAPSPRNDMLLSAASFQAVQTPTSLPPHLLGPPPDAAPLSATAAPPYDAGPPPLAHAYSRPPPAQGAYPLQAYPPAPQGYLPPMQQPQQGYLPQPLAQGFPPPQQYTPPPQQYTPPMSYAPAPAPAPAPQYLQGTYPPGSPQGYGGDGGLHASGALSSYQTYGSSSAGYLQTQHSGGMSAAPQPGMGYVSSAGGYPVASLATGVSQTSVGGGAGAVPPLSNIPATEVRFEISAKELRDRDMLSKSDPMAVVFEEVRQWELPVGSGVSGGGAEEQKWRKIGETESIKDELSPHFKRHVTVPYRFEELQNLRIGLWDIDSKNPALNMHDFLGDVRATLGDIVAAGEWTGKLSYPVAADNKTLLGRQRKLGTVTIRVHEDSKSDKIAVRFAMSALKLDKKDLFGKSDPYVVITQLKGRTNSRTVLYTSEVLRRTLNPTWKPVRILVDAPKGGTKKDVRIEIQVIDKDNHSRDDEIGVVWASLAELEESPRLTLVNSRNRKKGKNKASGTLVIDTTESLVLPTMINYLQGGLKLHFSVAVDLTASNGDPRNPASLHYMDPVSRSNQYVRALTAVANIITCYTASDNQCVAFGFGADIDNSGITSHCFPLSLQSHPYCVGLEGIFAAYGHALNTVKFSGPTNLTPLLDTVMKMSERRLQEAPNAQEFFCVLVLTDGVISDFTRTVDRIIEASHTSPLSIIIIGIGNANFKKMEILDGDDRVLTSSDGLRTVKRDIVQFVPLRDYEGGPPERLAAAVLAELPMQVVNYFTQLEPKVLPYPPPFTPQQQ